MSVEVALRQRLGAFTLDVAFSAPPGVTALFGRSGAGKTSVIQAIAGLSRPEAGRIVVDGVVLFDAERRVDVPRHRRRVGYVFQEGRLFPHLSVRGNLRFGQWFAPRGARAAEFDRVVEMLGIGDLLDRRPGGLSGGEKQRVAIGRALLAGPRILLMDEPLAALDEARKAEILPYLERLRETAKVPILYVSHSVAEVARLATTIVALSEGRVARAGPAAEVLAAAEMAPILGGGEVGVILSARVVAHAPDGLSALAVGGGVLVVPGVVAAVGARLRLRIRARDVMIALDRPERISALNALPVVVVALEAGEGGTVELRLRFGPDELRARITARSAGALGLAPGSACYAVLKSVAVDSRDVGVFEEADG